jgi:hypothetical protein
VPGHAVPPSPPGDPQGQGPQKHLGQPHVRLPALGLPTGQDQHDRTHRARPAG